MSTVYKLLYRFDFQTAYWDLRVAACLALIWLVILACAISSIRSQGMGAVQQRMWMVFVAAVPVVGLLAYLPFSVRRDEMPHYFRFRSNKPRHRPTVRSEVKKLTRPDDAA
ncbi:MAG: hypothetical protein ABMA13_04160 [Chthoniobacteraceae bacterium]